MPGPAVLDAALEKLKTQPGWRKEAGSMPGATGGWQPWGTAGIDLCLGW